MTVPELAEPRTGNGTNESRSVPVLANFAFGYCTKWKISGSGIKKRTVLEMGASTGNGCQFQYWQIARLGTYMHTFFKIGAGGTAHLFDPNSEHKFFTDIYLCIT